MVKTKKSSEKVLGDMIKTNLPSLIIGFTIFVLFIAALVNMIHNYNGSDYPTAAATTREEQQPNKKKNLVEKIKEKMPFKNAQKQDMAKNEIQLDNSYIVKEGESLWSIAEEHYHSGLNAYDIAQTNKLADANIIEVGQKLILPKITGTPTQDTTAAAPMGETSSIASGEVTIKTDHYQIKDGDTLWDIASQAYGDGYMWSRIAEANNLANPDLIYSGNSLVIPRNPTAEKGKDPLTSYNIPNF